MLVSVLATGISIVIAILAAYSLARLRFRGATSFGTAVFITYLVPTTLLFLPLAQVVNRLGLADSVWALIVTYPTFLVPFCTWLLLGYFRTIPQEIEECAMVDGCTRFQALVRIVLPVAIPGIVCAVLFAFTISWNEFIYASDVYLVDGSKDHDRGCDGRADPWGYFLLGFPDGRRSTRLDPDCARLRAVHGLLRLRSHPRGD